MHIEFLHLPNEILLYLFEQLPLFDVLAFYRVNQRCRSLVLNISEPLHRHLFQLAIRDIQQYPDGDHDGSSLISLPDRISYVTDIESENKIHIPDPYRTILMEWPVKRPPPDSHWPHAVRFHANGFCSCHRDMHENGMCRCRQRRFIVHDLTIEKTVLEEIRQGGPFDGQKTSDSRWELFSNPPRLHTDAQNAQTIRFILAYPQDGGTWRGGPVWTRLDVPVLRLSRYEVEDVSEQPDGGGSYTTGEFCMVLEGPARGQIHAWECGGWYDGFEAESYLEWHYEECRPLSEEDAEEPPETP